MKPPFSVDEFFESMAAYNTAVWPAQIVLTALALTALVLAVKSGDRRGKLVASILALFWVWMGVVYHWGFFTEINPAARLFGALFVVEGLLLLWGGMRQEGLQFEPQRTISGFAGGFLVAYALILYPSLGLALGHLYPAHPTFGLPCPSTIFTIGLLLWARPRVPWWLLVIPVAWSIIGGSAAFFFGVLEDLMLPVTVILGSALILRENRRALAV